MARLGIAVGEDKWGFFNEINEDLALYYQAQVLKTRTFKTPLLYGRINRWNFRQGIRSILRNNDVCFFEWASDYLAAASHMPKWCPIVTRLHSFELYEWAQKINWEHVDRVILVSQAMQRMFCDIYPDQCHKTTVIYNGISLQAFRPPDRRDFQFRLGMLCSINPIKRVYEVILMLSNLRRHGFDATLRIAGDPHGDYRYAAAVYSLVERLDLQNSVIFNGHVSDTPAWLQEVDIFISNSFWEGQQMALIEAMASGCYCLSHRWSGAEEILPEDNLYFVESELLEKIIHFAELGADQKLKRGKALRVVACDKFDIERTKSEIRQTIDQELGR